MCLFIFLIIFIDFFIPVNVSFSFNFIITFLLLQNIKDLMQKRLSAQTRLLKRSGRDKIKVFNRLQADSGRFFKNKILKISFQWKYYNRIVLHCTHGLKNIKQQKYNFVAQKHLCCFIYFTPFMFNGKTISLYIMQHQNHISVVNSSPVPKTMQICPSRSPSQIQQQHKFKNNITCNKIDQGQGGVGGCMDRHQGQVGWIKVWVEVCRPDQQQGCLELDKMGVRTVWRGGMGEGGNRGLDLGQDVGDDFGYEEKGTGVGIW